MRLWKLFLFDLRFQWKHGLYFVYFLVCMVYIGGLSIVPEAYLDNTLLLLTFSDPSALGLILAGGILLLERDQGVFENLFVTPVKTLEYILAKCFSLSCLSLTVAFAIHLSSTGWPVSLVQFVLAIVLTSSFFTLIGLAAAIRSRSINSFLLLSQLYSLIFILPVLDYLNLFTTSLFAVLPVQGTLMLLEGTSHPLTISDFLYAVCILLIWIGLAVWWVYSLLQRSVRTQDGDEKHV
ncbi:ABC transporter permease [Paenibacillus tepidiphilus]|uniref:fluoroquinolone export ABC transporter permease subunit n=1 Tax=Paenibacillus tepidiphilus TaxID=2608683 RepID=UPI00123BAA6F|nr:ABC transporter permease [Paenibacillus tepidiphilus]